MGIFSRITEIVNANINAMLDKAEDPEKMVKLMIHEMEDTLTEVKSAAAEVVADRIRLTRQQKQARESAANWQNKAQMALAKNREDLARQALERKLEAENRAGQAHERLAEVEILVKQYQDDIGRLEEKLGNAVNRQRALIANHQSAVNRKRVESKIHKLNTSGAFTRFESYEKRIDRLQAEAELGRRTNDNLDAQFRELTQDQSVETELQRLKNKLNLSLQKPVEKDKKTSAEEKQPLANAVN